MAEGWLFELQFARFDRGNVKLEVVKLEATIRVHIMVAVQAISLTDA